MRVVAEDVIELADIALYRAKALGRNQCVGFLPSDTALASPGKISMDNLRDEDFRFDQSRENLRHREKVRIRRGHCVDR